MEVWTYLLLLFCVGVTARAAEDLQKRIIGGQDCGEDKRQYQVKLISNKGKLLCGGSLIADRWILTAAHCKKGHMKVVLIPHPDPSKSQVVEVKSHEIYKDKKIALPFGKKKHDLMLLELKKEVHFQTIPLTDCQVAVKSGDVVQFAGYGSKTKGPNNERYNDDATVLQCADFTVSKEPCHNKPKGEQNKHCAHAFAVNTDSADVSSADEGGGVEFNSNLYGVFVASANEKYTHTGPAYFADICYPEYRNWIRRVTNV